MLNCIVSTGEVEEDHSCGTLLPEIPLEAVQNPLNAGVRGAAGEVGKVAGIQELEVDEIGDQSHLKDLLEDLTNIGGEGDWAKLLRELARLPNLYDWRDPTRFK